MANKALFNTLRGVRRADTWNQAGGKAYKMEDRAALAQLAMTGTLANAYYMDADAQLAELLQVAAKVEPDFLAKAAIYARRNGHMKDTPAALLAVLASVSPEHLAQAFPRVIDNGRMLRTFAQIMRSGATGRRSFGTRPKKLIQAWLNEASDEALLRASVGQSPSLADVIKMAHPKPGSKTRDAFYAWLIGRPCDVDLLPRIVQEYLSFQATVGGAPVPDVPFQMLTNLPLNQRQWTRIAERAGWQTLRMNLNTFLRHGVFDRASVRRAVAERLADRKAIQKARVFPYQLMAAWINVDDRMPSEIRDALARAMEIAVENAPELGGRIVVAPDVSGSMTSPVTGHRKGATSKMTYVDVAALVASAILRRNPAARVMPFDTKVHDVDISARASVVDNAMQLASYWGGGTACSAPLAKLNAEKARVDMVILVSDNQSWVDQSYGGGTTVMKEWTKLKRRNQDAKLVCIDIAPYANTPAHDRPDVLNIGGFSDATFDLIATFARGAIGPDFWAGEIAKVRL
jgi:60 kDa SS-A/Ro ribonucleoprotein